jgi:hypothetical protein
MSSSFVVGSYTASFRCSMVFAGAKTHASTTLRSLKKVVARTSLPVYFSAGIGTAVALLLRRR